MDTLSELLIKTYPQSISLEDGTTVTLRPLLKDDEAALLRYFGSRRQRTVSASRRT